MCGILIYSKSSACRFFSQEADPKHLQAAQYKWEASKKQEMQSTVTK